jgi:hypothetical protein
MSDVIEGMLGARARDRITGWSGIVTSVSRHLTGCDTVGITSENPAVDREKSFRWFDVTCVEVIEAEPESTRTLRALRRGRREEVPSAG